MIKAADWLGITSSAILMISLLLSCKTTPPERASSESRDYCHSGAYRLEDGQTLVISPVDLPNLRYRLLDGKSGKLIPEGKNNLYKSGSDWLSTEPPFLHFDLGNCGDDSIKVIQGSQEIKGSRIALPFKTAYFESGGDSLYGELFLPEATIPKALVVLQFGSGRISAVLYNYVQYLLPIYEIGVFVFDKRGTGKSSGKFTADFTTMADDMAEAVKTANSMIDVEIPVGVMGESQGGWVVPLTAIKTNVDFVVVSYGLAISPREENKTEVLNALADKNYSEEVIDKVLEVVEVTDLILQSGFTEGLEELAELKKKYGHTTWYQELEGDYTGPIANANEEEMREYKEFFNYSIDLFYDPVPVLYKVDVPMLWILGGMDDEAPSDVTFERLRSLQNYGSRTDVAFYPNADHGIIEVQQTSEGKKLLGRHSEGYFELLSDWILTRKLDKKYGDAILYPRKNL